MKIVRGCRKHLEGLSLLIVLLFIISGIEALKDVHVSVPQALKTFSTATLQCKYDLEGEPLYTVKWYKGRREFFRFVPKELPNTLVFPVPGIIVDLNKSGPNEVVLTEVRPEVTGRFYCEVSTDAPNFDTQSDSSFMYVIDVPDENPIIEISKEKLDYGYNLKANCTTPPSSPSMNVTWYINGIKMNVLKINLYPTTEPSNTLRPLYMTTSYIEKEMDDSIYQGEVVKVQCIATLFNLYRGENLRYIDDENNRPQPWPSSVIGITQNLSGVISVPVWTEILILLSVCILR